MKYNKGLFIKSEPPGESIDLFHQFDFFHKTLWYTFFVDSEKGLRMHSRLSNTWDNKTPLYKKKLREALLLDEYYDIVTKDKNLEEMYQTMQRCYRQMDYHMRDLEAVLYPTIQDVLVGHLKGVCFWSAEKDRNFEVADIDLKSKYWISPRNGYRVYRHGRRTQTFIPPKKLIKIDTFVENVLTQGHTNGLHELGFCTESSAESDIDTFKKLKDELQLFIQQYSSLTDYYQYKSKLLHEKRLALLQFEGSLYQEMGFYVNLASLEAYLYRAESRESNQWTPEESLFAVCGVDGSGNMYDIQEVPF